MIETLPTTPETPVRGSPAPATIALFAALGALLYVGLRLLAHDGEVTSFIRIGVNAVAEDAPERDDYDLVAGMGYDGKYHYRQAIDPLSTDLVVRGIELDRPAYRSARIGYPLAAWLLSGGGQTDAVPWSLIGVNVFSMAAIGGVGAAIARECRRSTWWGLVFAAWPGLLIGLGYDLAEPLEAALVLTALWYARQRRFLLVTAALCAAAATRESSLLISAAFLGAWLIPRVAPRTARRFGLGSGDVPLHSVVAPVATYVGLQLWATAQWADNASTGDATQATSHFSVIPGRSLVLQLGEWLADRGTIDLFSFFQVVLMILFFACAVTAAINRAGTATPVERIGVIGGVVAVLTLGIFDRTVVYLRWPNITAMLGVIVFLAVRPTDRPAWLTDRLVWGTVVALFASTLPVWIAI